MGESVEPGAGISDGAVVVSGAEMSFGPRPSGGNYYV